MPSPAANIALIILGLFTLLAAVGWYFKTRINTFVQALLTYSRRAERKSRSGSDDSTEQGA